MCLSALLIGIDEVPEILCNEMLFNLTHVTNEEAAGLSGLFDVCVCGEGVDLEESERFAPVVVGVNDCAEVLLALVQGVLYTAADYEMGDLKIITRYYPAASVSGDFMAVRELGEELYAVMLGDVSGHGMKAGMLTPLVYKIFVETLNEHTMPPQFLYAFNNALCDHLEAAGGLHYACLCYGVFDTRRKRFYFANAGMPFAYTAGYGIWPTEIEAVGTPAGMLHGTNYEQHIVEYEHGDVFLLYTDGLSDNRFKRDAFGFYETVTKILGTENAPEMLADDIAESFLDKHPNSQTDDLSFIVIKL